MNNNEILELAKQVIELAEKAPQLIILQRHCWKIAKGQRKEIPKKVVDDAFDVVEILIKEVCNTPDAISHVQKLVFRDVAYQMLLNQNVFIRN